MPNQLTYFVEVQVQETLDGRVHDKVLLFVVDSGCLLGFGVQVQLGQVVVGVVVLGFSDQPGHVVGFVIDEVGRGFSAAASL